MLVLVVERVAARDAGGADAADRLRGLGLTRRESEVALLLARRWSSREIAHVLRISPNTVRRHTERVLGKLGVNSRRDVAHVLRGR